MSIDNTKANSLRPEYSSWQAMKTRCYNKNHLHYGDYGGRGIKVCERWKSSFPNFIQDMGPKPDGYSLDRIDTNGDYCPENCRWVSWQKQQNNKRNNRKLTFSGETHTITEWADIIGIKRSAIYMRARNPRNSIQDILSSKRLRKKR